MKILFVVKSKVMEVLGPMYLTAVAKKAGHACTIVDAAYAVPAAKAWSPSLICYSVMTGDQSKFIQLNKELKQVHAFAAVVGGPHATFFPQDFEKEEFDYIVQGEAETWFANLLGDNTDYSDIDSIPFPNREAFPDMHIRDFISSRGCPHACRYCFNARWNEMFPALKQVRVRSPKSVVREIKETNPSFVYFQDSCFGVSMKWLKNFCTRYAKEVRVPFHCHLRPVQVTEERISFLNLANCRSTRFALETASDDLRRIIGRSNTSNAEALTAAKLLRHSGIKLMIQNMLALPTSKIEDDLATLEMNIRCQPDYAWASIFSPFPGTALGDECKDKGWYKGDYSDITDCFFDKSILEFSEEYKEQTYCLQQIFALAVEAQVLPTLEELTTKALPQFIHKAIRKIGDDRLYGGVI